MVCHRFQLLELYGKLLAEAPFEVFGGDFPDTEAEIHFLVQALDEERFQLCFLLLLKEALHGFSRPLWQHVLLFEVFPELGGV